MIKIITQKQEWHEFLTNVDSYDFYHTYEYHIISNKEDEKPVLITYKENDSIIGLPLLIRRVFNTNYFDATSVYGYVGPIHNINSDFNNNNFSKELNQYFIDQNIISVFSRLNPFIKNQNIVLNNLGTLTQLSKVVYIDLKKSLEDQKSVFSKTTKRYINKTRKSCSVKIGNSKKDIATFIELYYENMDRVKAKKFYYFNETYFYNFFNSQDFKTDILFAIHDETNEVISAAMMIKTNDIIQYHISGTKNDYLGLTPIRILIDEMRIKGTEQNYKYFNLGGGLGSTEDSLFNFKASFSKNFKDFKIWKYIVNQEIYNDLILENKISSDTDFFPLYRFHND